MRHIDVLLSSHDGPVPADELAAARERDAAGEPLCRPSTLKHVSDDELQRIRAHNLQLMAGLEASAKQHIAKAGHAEAMANRTIRNSWWRAQARQHRADAYADIELLQAYRTENTLIEAELFKRGYLMAAE